MWSDFASCSGIDQQTSAPIQWYFKETSVQCHGITGICFDLLPASARRSSWQTRQVIDHFWRLYDVVKLNISRVFHFRPPDLYHTCYTLSGISIAQHSEADNEPIVIGDTLNNELLPTHPLYNVPPKSVWQMYTHIQQNFAYGSHIPTTTRNQTPSSCSEDETMYWNVKDQWKQSKFTDFRRKYLPFFLLLSLFFVYARRKNAMIS